MYENNNNMYDNLEYTDNISAISADSSRSNRNYRTTMKTPVVSLEIPNPIDNRQDTQLITTIQKTNNNFNFVTDKSKEPFNLSKALKIFEKEFQMLTLEDLKNDFFQNNKKGSIIDDNIDVINPPRERPSYLSSNSSVSEIREINNLKQDDLDSLDMSQHSEKSKNTFYISVISHEDLNDNKEMLSPLSVLGKNENSTIFKDMDDSTIGSVPDSVTLSTLPIEYKYNNLSNWKPIKIDPKIEALKFKIMQDIVYREGLLIQLKSLLKKVDERYWKYSVERIKLSETNKSINSKELVASRNRINIIQNEISVAIAHIRSLSFDIIGEILKLRKLYTKAYATNESISVYWKEKNYLLKIYSDMKEIFTNRNSQSIRIWLGFDPNTFMIPDWQFNEGRNISEYNPQNKWQKTIFEKLFVVWFKSHSEFMSKQWKGGKFIGNTLLSVNESSDKSKEQWIALRDQAVNSWGLDEGGMLRQGFDFAPDYWNDVKKNPFVVEATVGFLETFPTFNIVPILPKDLFQKCHQMENIIQKEIEMTSQLSSIRSECKSLKETINLESRTINLDASIKEQRRLKSRQQGESSLLTGISIDYTPSTFSNVDINSNYSIVNSRNDVFSRQQSSEDDRHNNKSFITESIHTYGLTDNDSAYTSHFGSQLIDISDFKFFRIENSNLKEVFQQKIENKRKVVEFRDLKPSLIQERKGKKILNRLSKQWMTSVIIRIQRVVRGFLGRRKAKREYDHKFMIQKAIRVQNFIRIRLAKKTRQFRKLRLQKEAFFIRKEYIKQYKAAITLTNFVRYIVNLKRKINNEPLLQLNTDALKLKFNKMYENNKSPSKAKHSLLISDGQDEVSSHKGDLEDEEEEEDGETEEAIQRENELNEKNFVTSEEEVKRRKMEKLNAIMFVKNLNKDKIQRDSIRSCRLIPVQVIRNSTSQMKINKMSIRSQHVFLPNITPTVVRSASSADIYQGVKTLRKKTMNTNLSVTSISRQNEESSMNNNNIARKSGRQRTISTSSGFGEALEKKILDKELVEAEAFKSALRKYI